MNFRIGIVCLLLLSLLINSCSKKSADTPPPTVPAVPGCAAAAAPASGSFITNTSVTLSWTAATSAASYDLYLGTSAIPTTLIASNLTGTNYNYTVPATPNTTYYWYIAPKMLPGLWPAVLQPSLPLLLSPYSRLRHLAIMW